MWSGAWRDQPHVCGGRTVREPTPGGEAGCRCECETAYSAPCLRDRLLGQATHTAARKLKLPT